MATPTSWQGLLYGKAYFMARPTSWQGLLRAAFVQWAGGAAAPGPGHWGAPAREIIIIIFLRMIIFLMHLPIRSEVNVLLTSVGAFDMDCGCMRRPTRVAACSRGGVENGSVKLDIPASRGLLR